jgi:hypothetical protein
MIIVTVTVTVTIVEIGIYSIFTSPVYASFESIWW